MTGEQLHEPGYNLKTDDFMDQKSILTTFCINRTELDIYERGTKLNWISPLIISKFPVMLLE